MFFCCLFLGTVEQAPKHVCEGMSGIQKRGEIKGPTMVGIDRGSGNFDVRYALWKVDGLDGIKRQCKSKSCTQFVWYRQKYHCKILFIPDTPCMEYLPTFIINVSQI